MSEEDAAFEKKIRQIVGDEIASALKNWKFEIEVPPTTLPKEDIHLEEDCPECGTKLKGKPKYCPECGAGELDYET